MRGGTAVQPSGARSATGCEQSDQCNRQPVDDAARFAPPGVSLPPGSACRKVPRMLQHPCSAPSREECLRGVRSGSVRRWLGWRSRHPRCCSSSGRATLTRSRAHRPIPPVSSAQYREINPIRNVDIVFVIDNSGSMTRRAGEPGPQLPAVHGRAGRPAGRGFPHRRRCPPTSAPAPAPRNQRVRRRRAGTGACSADVQGNDFCARCGVDISRGRFLRTVNPNFAGNIRDVFSCMATLRHQRLRLRALARRAAQALLAPENARLPARRRLPGLRPHHRRGRLHRRRRTAAVRRPRCPART